MAHIDTHYFEFAELQERGLDALIITGANPVQSNLVDEEFWAPLLDIVEWAGERVASILCSCLATHALVKSFHGIERTRLPRKKWGVYSHGVCAPEHPLIAQINTRFDAPHSRYNDISKEQLEAAGLKVLIESDVAGVHLAVSPDLFRIVYFQGHPEYDAISLLKEYKREVLRYINDVRDTEPPLPRNYFHDEAAAVCSNFLAESLAAKSDGVATPKFPEAELTAMVANTWGDTGKAIVNNWLGLVYQLSDLDRRKQFMDGVSPDDPLGLRTA